MSFLRRLFGGGDRAGASDGGIYVYVRCNACQEVIRARINPSAELSLMDDRTYYVRKVLVGERCFRPIELHLRYADTRGTELSREAHGGTFVEPDQADAAR